MRGGASGSRGGAAAVRGGASGSRGAAVAARGGAHVRRGGAALAIISVVWYICVFFQAGSMKPFGLHNT